MVAESGQEVDLSSESGSHIIQGTGLSATFGGEEAQKIHQENLSKLSSMTPEEIIEERNKLLQMLGISWGTVLVSKKMTTYTLYMYITTYTCLPIDIGNTYFMLLLFSI